MRYLATAELPADRVPAYPGSARRAELSPIAESLIPVAIETPRGLLVAALRQSGSRVDERRLTEQGGVASRTRGDLLSILSID